MSVQAQGTEPWAGRPSGRPHPQVTHRGDRFSSAPEAPPRASGTGAAGGATGTGPAHRGGPCARMRVRTPKNARCDACRTPWWPTHGGPAMEHHGPLERRDEPISNDSRGRYREDSPLHPGRWWRASPRGPPRRAGYTTPSAQRSGTSSMCRVPCAPSQHASSMPCHGDTSDVSIVVAPRPYHGCPEATPPPRGTSLQTRDQPPGGPSRKASPCGAGGREKGEGTGANGSSLEPERLRDRLFCFVIAFTCFACLLSISFVC